jgi:hypothetical protein
MTAIWTWLRARWKGCLVALGALGGVLLFWRARKPRLPWDDDPTPVDLPPQVMTPQEGALRRQEIERADEEARRKDAADLAARKKRALDAANKWGAK